MRAEITWFQYMDRFGFCVRAENELRFFAGIEWVVVFVWVAEIDLISVWGMELDLVSM